MTKKQIMWTLVAVVIIGAILIGTSPKKAAAPSEESTLSENATASETGAVSEPESESESAPAATTPSAPRATMKDGMKIETTTQGSGPAIENGQTAVVNYTGTLSDGTAFDSNIDPKFGHVQPFSFQLGAGMVIKGWEEGVLGMKVGETRTLTIPPELAYGAGGVPGAIPGNATLTFVVTLTAIK